MSKRKIGRSFFFNPGPTNVPDRVLKALHQPSEDFHAPRFLEVHARVQEGIKRVLKTRQHALLYAANGHGAWEAALVNAFKPGDRVLVPETGRFSTSWGEMAAGLGLVVETLHADWRRAVDLAALEARLAADTRGEIKGVLACHNETSTGLTQPVAAMRKAMDAARHPALLLADTISSLASIDFRMDEWGVDITVGGSQKGLMMVTGMSFTGVSERAFEIAKSNPTPRSYLDWRDMGTAVPHRFPGTTPVHLVHGLDEGLRMIEEEGLDAVFARHTRLARATRAAVAHWGGGGANDVTITAAGIAGKVRTIGTVCSDPSRMSDSVTAVMLPDGHSADAVRKIAYDRFNLSLGGGLACLADRVFRIGHMGDLNEPMLLGALGTVELSLGLAGVPHKRGGVEAAIASLGAG